MTIRITKPCSAHQSKGTVVGLMVGTAVEMIARDAGDNLLIVHQGRQLLVPANATDYAGDAETRAVEADALGRMLDSVG